MRLDVIDALMILLMLVCIFGIGSFLLSTVLTERL
jgi:hypothetical protein